MIRAIFDGIGRLPRPLVIVLSCFLVLIIGSIDYMTVSDVSIAIFYILPVSIAAWFLSSRWGIGISIACTVVWFAADYFTSVSYSHPIVPYWNALVMYCIFALGSFAISGLRASQQRENSIARDIQAGLMLRQMPEIAGLDVAATWLPASNVGGDCFDILRIDNSSVAVCVADAAGHGVTAALLISHFQATLRMLAMMYPSPKLLCSRINNFIFTTFGPANLITFFYGVLDITKNIFVYTNAGQTRPIVVHADGTTTELCDGGIPLGVQAEFGYDEGAIALVPGDCLVLYTDGVLELKNKKGEMFGIQKLTDLLMKQADHAAAAVLDSIMNAVNEFGRSAPEDDLTVLVVSLMHPAPEPRQQPGIPATEA